MPPPDNMFSLFSTSTTAAATTTTTAAVTLEQPPTAQLSLEADPETLLKTLGMKAEDVWDWAQRKPTPLRLADMYKYAANPDFRIPNAVFLHTELPIRIAQRAVDLLTLPFGLSEAAPIRQVACTYIRYLHTLLSTPVPKTVAEEEHFTQVLQSFVLDRSSIPHAIAEGLAIWQSQELDHGAKPDPERYHEMEEALYRFFTARVGLRFLTEHHVLSNPRLQDAEEPSDLRQVTCMFEQDAHDQADTVGCIQSHTDLAKEVKRVADLVREQCAAEWGRPAPPIEIVNCTTTDNKHDDEFTYVPHHLQYMMMELLKNSVRATLRHQERHGAKAAGLIRVVLVKGAEDVTIKVADKAGGIPRSRMAQIWKFAHSTDVDGSSTADPNAPMLSHSVSGAQLRGFGLPITRIYARYFGGELTLKSMEGYGLDAYLHLPRLGKSGEHLPSRVRASPGELDSLPLSSSSSISSYGRFWSMGSSRNFSSSAMSRQHALEDEEIRSQLLALVNGGQRL